MEAFRNRVSRRFRETISEVVPVTPRLGVDPLPQALSPVSGVGSERGVGSTAEAIHGTEGVSAWRGFGNRHGNGFMEPLRNEIRKRAGTVAALPHAAESLFVKRHREVSWNVVLDFTGWRGATVHVWRVFLFASSLRLERANHACTR